MNLKYWELCVYIMGGLKLVLGFMESFPKEGTFTSLKVWKMNKNQLGKEGASMGSGSGSSSNFGSRGYFLRLLHLNRKFWMPNYYLEKKCILEILPTCRGIDIHKDIME